MRGGMTDAQRKERAAQMAMQLFALMGGEDGDEEEEEGEAGND